MSGTLTLPSFPFFGFSEAKYSPIQSLKHFPPLPPHALSRYAVAFLCIPLIATEIDIRANNRWRLPLRPGLRISVQQR